MRKSSHYKKNRAAFYKRLKKMLKINKETIEAMQETLDIESGKIPAKRYKSARELFEDNNKYLYRQNVSK